MAEDKKPEAEGNSLLRIDSLEDFDKVSRTHHQNTPYALPHVMFVIDRQLDNRVYYVNTQKYKYHKDFLYATGLAPLGTDVYQTVYFAPDRRFIVGSVAWQKPVEKWTWEVWEGDSANVEHITIAHRVINETFFADVSFKPNSTRQHDNGRTASVSIVTQDEILKNQEYMALNPGKTIGRVHIIEKLDDTVEIGDNEIIILRELPVTLPPVAGIIVAKPSSPLSHINILAKGWRVPNVYIKDADILFKEFDTKWIELDATMTGYAYRFADKSVLDQYKPPDIRQAPANLRVRRLAGLREQRAKDSVIYGAKAANQGEMMNSTMRGFVIPDGFSIPFHWYDLFMKKHGFDKYVQKYLDDMEFVHNPRYRRGKLTEFREMIQNAEFNPQLRAQIVARWRTQLGGRPVFVRSSSNAEDLPNFTGAGLYSTVPNVRTADELIEAVKKVWASLWRFEAYEARERNYIDHETVYMSALIQFGVDMERGGVLFSADPFGDPGNQVTYITVVCGHNDQITANGGMPEQVLVNRESSVVRLKTLSQIQSTLRFSSSGGLSERAGTCADPRTSRILTDEEALRLARISAAAKRLFGGIREQDIEWGMIGSRIYILQARPLPDKQ
jgi:rifampicin phosphotransferase